MIRRASAACIMIAALLSPMLASAAEGAEPVRITMWDIPESAPYGAWWRAHIADFNRRNPDVQVTLEVFETEAYRPKIASALAAGTQADIFYLPVGRQGQAAVRARQALTLDGLLDAGAFTNAAIAACSVDGKIACMPLYVAPIVLFYNRDLFDRAGVDPASWRDAQQPTWGEFLAACDKLKAAHSIPIALGNTDNWPGAMYLWALQDRLGGVAELDAAIDGRTGLRFSTAPGFTSAAERIAKLGQSGNFPMGYNGIGASEASALFTSGRAAIALQGPWWLGRVATEAPADFRLGFFAFPSLPGAPADDQRDILGGFDALYVSARTPHPEAVARFLNSFADPAAALSFMTDTGNVPVVKTALETLARSDETIGGLARLVAEAPHVAPWWDDYMPPVLAEASMRRIQGLFDGSVAPAQYLARLDQAAGR